jgi:hypothetical protein
MTYFFKCLLNTGEFITQGPEDLSKTDPTRNAFYDVLQNLDKVRAFALYSEDGKNEWLVDLEDGHFEHNMEKFSLCDEEVTNRRLIYFKRNTLNFAIGSPVPTDKKTKYYFGFQCNTSSGENRKFILSVS